MAASNQEPQPSNYNPMANGGSMGTVTPVPGAIPIVGQTQAATAAGKSSGEAPYQIIDTINPVTNQPSKSFAGSVLTPPRPPWLAQSQQGSVAPAVSHQQGIAPTQPVAPVTQQSAPVSRGIYSPTAQNQNVSDYMKNDYSPLAQARAAAPAMQQELGRMSQIGQNPTMATGPYGTSVAKLFSNDAAEYEKGRDFVVSQLASSGGMSTDAARSMVYGAIPGYEAPQQAKLAGLQNLINQIGVKSIKADLMTSPFSKGDSAGYTNLSNQFDQHISPSMYPVLSMPAGQQRAQALAQLSKNPTARANLEWAVQNGILK
jgi:hypothetical protein